ncbi:MAG: hypothetical protein MPEBLZ_04390 [Candidatus Methanoperedens nitroreducens]|uniref:Uncharacterized protein n=1 Tax=Candidatus Methanoperedens nitratireducens TaxID=1392998 RepID=A0A0P7ZCA5_9EURY|nr:MAG: hypothetical protein F9K14_03220 [Candidatus Methanoperedens sp.]KPQ41076.1 MAG: hypothetical protein MPEBLZ_04390 [Candidatus Methanoperedens sp. BLZ1]MBZ0175241.1 hypothetical protein [Candidatus Methanoperedens nitroreducens]
MNNIDCKSRIDREYESTQARLLKGDKKRLEQICEQINEVNEKRDGFLRLGINRCTRSDAVSAAIDCYFEKHGLKSAVASETV